MAAPGAAGRSGRPATAAFPRFHVHNVARFTPHELQAWRGGRWRRDWHRGRFGWWWVLDRGWYFYPMPAYPYPDYVSEDFVAEPGGGFAYYCPDPPGYYPEILTCFGPWQPVPITP